MVATIEIQNLSKRYGDLNAVDQLSLSIEQGEIFGFVGPNGAGKTSTIRMIAGLLQPTSGEIYVAGNSVKREPAEVKRLIGYMPDYFGVYPDLKIWEYLEFFSACYQIPERQRPTLIGDLLELFDLEHRREDMVDHLSRGMKQRLGMARTLIHDPQVLVLDEPAAGLDPRARVEIRESLVELSHMGKTIFFSTHILADVAEICTRVGIIEAGKLVAAGNLEDLQSQIIPHRRIEISLLDCAQEAEMLLTGLPGVYGINTFPNNQENGGGKIRYRLIIDFSGEDLELSQVLAELVRHGIPVLCFNEDNRGLEEVFLRATKGIVT